MTDDLRHARRRLPLTDLYEIGIHTDRSLIREEMPDSTMSQLMLKLALMDEAPSKVDLDMRRGYLVVVCSMGEFDFVIDSTDLQFETDQVL